MNGFLTITITDVATATAALSAAVIAIFGLRTWNRQLKGTIEYDLARRLMLQVYRIRNELKSTRSPFVSVGEGEPDDTEETWQITAYGKRWKRVTDLLSEFDVMVLESEVVWDNALSEARTSLMVQVKDLNFALEMFVRQKRNPAFQEDFERDYHDIVYAIGDDDAYNISLKESVRLFESFLKPQLRR